MEAIFFGSGRDEDNENSDLDFCVVSGKEVDIKLEEKELSRKFQYYS